MRNYLEFEKEIKSLEEDLENSKNPFDKDGISEIDTGKIKTIQKEIDEKLNTIYSGLNSWQKTLVARHEDRPRANFYIDKIFKNFTQLSGDRLFGEDKSIIAGFGLIDNKSVLVLGQEKGDSLDSRLERNFGMMKPEGYRKCIRLMKLADRFKVPVISFIDTPGAYPGMGAEKRGQALAIAESIDCCMSLNVPNISIIIGEGGSGGAIALASSSKVIMLENAIYSVISPEGCATILWRDPKKTLEAATAMKLSSKDLLELRVIDEIIEEPLGGAHRDKNYILEKVKKSIQNNLNEFLPLSRDEVYNKRKEKFLSIGRNKGFTPSSGSKKSLSLENNILFNMINKLYKRKFFYISCMILILLLTVLLMF